MTDFCIVCKKEITKGATRCRTCSNKSEERRAKQRKLTGKKSSNYRHGKCCTIIYCKDCNKKLSSTAFYQGCKRCRSCAAKLRTGDKNSNWRGSAAKVRQQMFCSVCGNRIHYSAVWRNEKYCASCWEKGDKNHNWKGGKTSENNKVRQSAKYKKWRDSVFQKDGYICQACGGKSGVHYLQAHHIKPFADYPELRLDVNNGITLCSLCHVGIIKKYKSNNTCPVCGERISSRATFCQSCWKKGLRNPNYKHGRYVNV